MLRTRLTGLLGIERPIIQGGLAHLALAELAAAVSNAGGLGQINAATLSSPEDLRREIGRTRVLTNRPFGVNFALGRRPAHAFLEEALAAGVAAVSFTEGNPEEYLKLVQGTPVKKLVLVASTRQAQKSEQMGADAVIAVGHEGGGHLGRDGVGSMVLIPRVVDAVRIPVVASGGIGDGRGLAAALALGAEGIEMGTRFVATQECIAHPNYKQALVQAREADTVLIERTIGRPGRVLDGPWPQRILEGEAQGATLEQLLSLIGREANRRAALEGVLDEGFVWAGQVVGLIEDVPTVQDLLDRILIQAEAACRRLGILVANT